MLVGEATPRVGSPAREGMGVQGEDVPSDNPAVAPPARRGWSVTGWEPKLFPRIFLGHPGRHSRFATGELRFLGRERHGLVNVGMDTDHLVVCKPFSHHIHPQKVDDARSGACLWQTSHDTPDVRGKGAGRAWVPSL